MAAKTNPEPLSDSSGLRPPSELLAGARAQIRRNAGTLRAVELYVDGLLERGETLAAAAWCQIAGDFASCNHPGRFRSAALERVLTEIGRRLTPTLDRVESHLHSAHDVKRIVHVLTEGYSTGGHTRLARRWIERDDSREHSVIFTRQRTPLPEGIRAAAEATGGYLVRLASEDDLLQRASALRRLTADADMIVLHHHMFDVVPALAFADRESRPPILCEDHADHRFWIGTEVVDALAELRVPSCRVATERRGFDARDVAIVPIPLQAPRQARDRDEARAILDVASDAEVLLTVASPHKYMPVLGVTFHELIASVLHERPRAVLLAAGPTREHPGWMELTSAFPDRVRTFGVVDEPEALFAAADVYLDSYPCASGTSALEAALCRLPVVSFAPDIDGQGSLLAHGAGLERQLVREVTVDAWQDAVQSLLDDPAVRHERADSVRDSVREIHISDSWITTVANAYDRALAARAIPPRRHPVVDPVDPSEWECVFAMLFEASGDATWLGAKVSAHIQDLPSYMRPATSAQLVAMTRWTGASHLPPDPDTVRRVLGELRTLGAAGVLEPTLAVTASPPALEPVATLIERDLEEYGDLDIVLTPADEGAGASVSDGVRRLVVT